MFVFTRSDWHFFLTFVTHHQPKEVGAAPLGVLCNTPQYYAFIRWQNQGFPPSITERMQMCMCVVIVLKVLFYY